MSLGMNVSVELSFELNGGGLNDRAPQSATFILTSTISNQFKGTVSPDFSPLVFFFKQLLLAPVDKPSNDFDFFRIFAEIFDFAGASTDGLFFY